MAFRVIADPIVQKNTSITFRAGSHIIVLLNIEHDDVLGKLCAIVNCCLILKIWEVGMSKEVDELCLRQMKNIIFS